MAEHRAASQDTSPSAAEGKGLEEYKKSEALLCRASRGARMGWGGAGKGLRARNYHKQTVFADASALQLFSGIIFQQKGVARRWWRRPKDGLGVWASSQSRRRARPAPPSVAGFLRTRSHHMSCLWAVRALPHSASPMHPGEKCLFSRTLT